MLLEEGKVKRAVEEGSHDPPIGGRHITHDPTITKYRCGTPFIGQWWTNQRRGGAGGREIDSLGKHLIEKYAFGCDTTNRYTSNYNEASDSFIAFSRRAKTRHCCIFADKNSFFFVDDPEKSHQTVLRASFGA